MSIKEYRTSGIRSYSVYSGLSGTIVIIKYQFYIVWGTRSSMLDWVIDAGLSCTKGVWYRYDWDTG